MGYSRQWVARPNRAPANAVLHTAGAAKGAPGHVNEVDAASARRAYAISKFNAYSAHLGPPLGVRSSSRRSSMTLTRDSPFPRVDIVIVKGLNSQAAAPALTVLAGRLLFLSKR